MPKPLACAMSVVVGCFAAGLVIAQGPPAAGAAAPGTAPPPTTPPGHADAAPKQPAPLSPAEEKKALYALGVLLSRNVDAFSLTPADFATVNKGFTDGYHHTASVKDAEAQLPQVQALERTRSRKAGDAYLAKAAAAPGATRTPSGLVYTSLKEGTGASPSRTDRVKVNYEGKLMDGTVFDSSAQHGGQPLAIPMTGVIACWTEALQRMKVGGKAHFVCPSSIAYGDRGSPPRIRPGATLDFTVELTEILPPAPTDASGTPAQPPNPSIVPPTAKPAPAPPPPT